MGLSPSAVSQIYVLPSVQPAAMYDEEGPFGLTRKVNSVSSGILEEGLRVGGGTKAELT